MFLIEEAEQYGLETDDIEILEISLDGIHNIVVVNKVPLDNYFLWLAQQEDPCEVLSITEVQDLGNIPHQLYSMPHMLITDGIICGVKTGTAYNELLLKDNSTYIAWKNHMSEIPVELASDYQRTSQGTFFVHHIITNYSLNRLRRCVLGLPLSPKVFKFDRLSLSIRGREKWEALKEKEKKEEST